MDFWDFWVFPDFSRFFRIFISCSNFDLKKLNFLILYFLKFIFFYLHLFYFFLFFAKFKAKKLSQFLKFPKVNVLESPFYIYFSRYCCLLFIVMQSLRMRSAVYSFLLVLCNTNLVPRVLWLFGQRMGASRDSGEFEKINFFDWLPSNDFHCFIAEILR